MSTPDQIRDWMTEAIPHGWFTQVEVRSDKDEVLVIGHLRPVADESDSACIARFREQTRQQRMDIARRGERAWKRAISWGAVCGPTEQLFTTVSVPAMTRLRLHERAVLDTLIDAGVARSRSEALAWCVRLVAANEETWLAELREAFEAVDRVRRQGPAGNLPAT